jgi:hypothetical protein
MISVKSIEDARANRTLIARGENRESWISRYFLSAKETPERPMGFLVEKKPHDVVHPHFHACNQFQVIVGGYGRLGKFPVRPFSMYYTNGFTGYGPIVGEDDGIAFLTLRNRWDAGARYLPQQRSEMLPAKKRHKMAGNIPISGAAALADRATSELETLVEPEADGLASWFMRVAPGDLVKGPDPTTGGGQYYVVASGTLVYEDRELPHLSMAYVSADGDALPVQAGPGGVEVLVMQFPNAEAYQPA